MLPEIHLQGNIDVVAKSPLLRGMVLSISYAERNGGIGLTPSGAMNRKFVDWAAGNFLWPDYTREELYSVNKVLNEGDMPPLWPVRHMSQRLKLLRKDGNLLVPTKRGRSFLANPGSEFEVIVSNYLYSYVDRFERAVDVRERLHMWEPLLPLLDVEAARGCSPTDVLVALYPELGLLSETQMALQTWDLRTELKYGFLRRLCWIGLLYEQRQGLTLLQDGVYYKTPLWSESFRFHRDDQKELVRH
jgi:hypothetical protein